MLADRVRMGSGSEKFDPSTWKGIQEIVRSGLTSEYFQVGDELVSGYENREIIWQVIGIGVDTPSDSNFTHSMTIQTKDCVENRVWDSASDNRYINSSIRAYLNSTFLGKLDPELSAVIGQVNKKVALSDAIGQDSFSDKVFLLSRKEIDLDDGGVVTTGQFVYPFYNGKGSANRIKNLDGSATYWWLRSPRSSNTNSVWRVNKSGTIDNRITNGAYGVSPACVII